jgi:thymidylate synthase (FAD)
MTVTLLHNTPLWINAYGARTCWDSGDKSDSQCWDDQFSDNREWVECGPKDMELIDRVGNKFRHASILEHVTYNFSIEGISRACLQELARHRIASLSVKSTRYTLKELKEEEHFLPSIFNESEYVTVFDEDTIRRASKYIVMTESDIVNDCSIYALENLKLVLERGISNDIAKYCLPESYKTSLTWSINMRSLQNFLSLRSDKSALWEIRDLANMVYDSLPEDHKYIYKDHIKEVNEPKV